MEQGFQRSKPGNGINERSKILQQSGYPLMAPYGSVTKNASVNTQVTKPEVIAATKNPVITTRVLRARVNADCQSKIKMNKKTNKKVASQ